MFLLELMSIQSNAFCLTILFLVILSVSRHGWPTTLDLYASVDYTSTIVLKGRVRSDVARETAMRQLCAISSTCDVKRE